MTPVDAGAPTSRRGDGVIARYAAWLDVDDDTPRVTLGEGGTPLVHAHRLSEQLGVEVHLKLEIANPTGSFKDRGMCMAVARAVQAGAHTLICASTGNTSASAAAFAAAAGLRCVVVIPSGKIALGKLLQAQVTGATVVAVGGNFDEALDAVRELALQPGIALVNSVNPYRIEGQKTAAFEVCEDLGGDPPDWLCIPVGNAGNITSYWRGFREWREHGFTTRLPQLLGVQAAGAAPLVDGAPVDHPETIATAIRIGRPARGDEALAAIGESKGTIIKRTDDEILTAYRRIARDAGTFAEPASCSSIAGLLWALDEGLIEPGSRVVCVLTGHGLKDPDTAATQVQPLIQCDEATAEAISAAIGSAQ
jgi:threonine synthase